jgi:hypothetical protein
MLPAILSGAASWMNRGLPLSLLKIMVLPHAVEEATEIFKTWVVREYPSTLPPDDPKRPYDVFVSYAWSDGWPSASLIREVIHSHKPTAKVFIDQLEIEPGAPFPQQIFDSLNGSRSVMLLLTPGFLDSKTCMFEANVALYRTLQEDLPLLMPILTLTSELPNHLAVIQYSDCREGDPAAIQKATEALISDLFPS